MSYLNSVQSSIIFLGDQENLIEAKYVTKGLLFYSFFYLATITEFVIFILTVVDSNSNHVYYKYQALIFFPIPILNLLEYLYVERMGSVDGAFDNVLIVGNNFVTLIFMVDILRRLIDMTIYSFDDFILTIGEVLPLISGIILFIVMIIRLLLNISIFGEIGPIQEINQRNLTNSCNTFDIAKSNLIIYDYIIVVSSLLVIFFGFIYVFVILTKRKDVEVINISSTASQKYIRKFISLGLTLPPEGFRNFPCSTDKQEKVKNCSLCQGPNKLEIITNEGSRFISNSFTEKVIPLGNDLLSCENYGIFQLNCKICFDPNTPVLNGLDENRINDSKFACSFLGRCNGSFRKAIEEIRKEYMDVCHREDSRLARHFVKDHSQSIKKDEDEVGNDLPLFENAFKIIFLEQPNSKDEFSLLNCEAKWTEKLDNVKSIKGTSFPCKSTNCLLCQNNMVERTDLIKSTFNSQKTRSIKLTLNCQSHGLIYVMTCRDCNKQYLSSTVRSPWFKFNDRAFDKYNRNFKLKNSGGVLRRSSFSFNNSINNSISDMDKDLWALLNHNCMNRNSFDKGKTSDVKKLDMQNLGHLYTITFVDRFRYNGIMEKYDNMDKKLQQWKDWLQPEIY